MVWGAASLSKARVSTVANCFPINATSTSSKTVVRCCQTLFCINLPLPVSKHGVTGEGETPQFFPHQKCLNAALTTFKNAFWVILSLSTQFMKKTGWSHIFQWRRFFFLLNVLFGSWIEHRKRRTENNILLNINIDLIKNYNTNKHTSAKMCEKISGALMYDSLQLPIIKLSVMICLSTFNCSWLDIILITDNLFPLRDLRYFGDKMYICISCIHQKSLTCETVWKAGSKH